MFRLERGVKTIRVFLSSSGDGPLAMCSHSLDGKITLSHEGVEGSGGQHKVEGGCGSRCLTKTWSIVERAGRGHLLEDEGETKQCKDAAAEPAISILTPEPQFSPVLETKFLTCLVYPARPGCGLAQGSMGTCQGYRLPQYRAPRLWRCCWCSCRRRPPGCSRRKCGPGAHQESGGQCLPSQHPGWRMC